MRYINAATMTIIRHGLLAIVVFMLHIYLQGRCASCSLPAERAVLCSLQIKATLRTLAGSRLFLSILRNLETVPRRAKE